MRFKMAEPQDNYADDSTEVSTSLLYLAPAGLVTTTCSQAVLSSKPLSAYNCIYDSPQKENMLPVDDLYATYNCTTSQQSDSFGENGIFNLLDQNMVCSSDQLESYSSSEEEILSNQDLTLDKDEIARDLLRNEGPDHETSLNDLINTIDVKPSSTELNPTCESPSAVSGDDDSSLGSSNSDELPSASSEDELPSSTLADYELIAKQGDEDEVPVGPEHQAVIPQLLSPSSRSTIVDAGERVLWDPSVLPEEEVEAYYSQLMKQNRHKQSGDGCNVSSRSDGYIRDDEQALYLLLQCGYNVEEAMRRRQCEVIPPIDVLKLWTQEECENFETSLRMHGKNFHKIRQHKFRTRSVKELVHYYYTWKKTNRARAKLLVRHSSNSSTSSYDGPSTQSNYSQARSSTANICAQDNKTHCPTFVQHEALSHFYGQDVAQSSTFLHHEATPRACIHDMTQSPNYSSYDAPSVNIHEYTYSPHSTQSPIYSDLKLQMYDSLPLTESTTQYQWPVFRVDQDYRQSDLDFTLTARPNFDAVSVMSTSAQGMPVYSDSDCYGHPLPHASVFSGQPYMADGFPETCFHKPILRSQSADLNYPVLTNDVYMDMSLSAPPPLKRFKSSSTEYQRYSVDDFPADLLLQNTAERTDRSFPATLGAIPSAPTIANLSQSTAGIFPTSSCSLFSQWGGSTSIHS